MFKTLDLNLAQPRIPLEQLYSEYHSRFCSLVLTGRLAMCEVSLLHHASCRILVFTFGPEFNGMTSPGMPFGTIFAQRKIFEMQLLHYHISSERKYSFGESFC